jgi:hypothetical protein
VVAGGALLLVPLLALPAGADPVTTTVSQRITFIDDSGYGVTCELDATVTRDHDAKTLSIATSSTGISSTDDQHHLVDCEGFREVAGYVAVDYVDAGGRSRHAEAQGTMPDRLDIDHVASSIQLTATAQYSACDAAASTTCTVSVAAAPK